MLSGVVFVSECSGFSKFMSIYICNSQRTPGWSYICYDFNTLASLKFRKLRFSVFQDVPLAGDIAQKSVIL